MKIKNILSCALAAGLMNFATESRASDVIDNTLYLPLNIKGSVTFDVNGKNKKATLTDKILTEDILELPKDTKLMVNADTFDVWAFSKKDDLQEDLTADGVLTISNTQTGSSSKGIVETDTGTTEINFYDNPQFDGSDLDTTNSENSSGNWFEITGNYTLKQSEGSVNKKGLIKVSQSFSTTDLTGSIFVDEAEDSVVPLTKGSATAKGSGELEGP
jgi:hypothetical protein